MIGAAAAAASRRSFFGWCAATPLAAKASADRAVADLMKIDVDGAAFGANITGGEFGGVPSQENAIPWKDHLKRCVNYVNVFGLPPEIDEIYRDQSKVVYRLDADIANKRSWSMAFKVLQQQQRNYENKKALLSKQNSRAWVSDKLRKAIGVEFPTW
jgi:hypothetical protein